MWIVSMHLNNIYSDMQSQEQDWKGTLLSGEYVGLLS